MRFVVCCDRICIGHEREECKGRCGDEYANGSVTAMMECAAVILLGENVEYTRTSRHREVVIHSTLGVPQIISGQLFQSIFSARFRISSF